MSIQGSLTQLIVIYSAHPELPEEREQFQDARIRANCAFQPQLRPRDALNVQTNSSTTCLALFYRAPDIQAVLNAKIRKSKDTKRSTNHEDEPRHGISMFIVI